MKDWKVWALLIGVYLLVKMCGGCNACSSYGDVRSESISELKQIIRESGTITEDEAKALVVHYILNNMKDPNSYESVSWGPLKKTQEIDGEGYPLSVVPSFNQTLACQKFFMTFSFCANVPIDIIIASTKTINFSCLKLAILQAPSNTFVSFIYNPNLKCT